MLVSGQGKGARNLGVSVGVSEGKGGEAASWCVWGLRACEARVVVSRIGVGVLQVVLTIRSRKQATNPSNGGGKTAFILGLLP